MFDTLYFAGTFNTVVFGGLADKYLKKSIIYLRWHSPYQNYISLMN
jgi:hypothetical protein